ncbi:putative retrovirus-related pol polyprotein from transposon tnt [Operophtera brumata]|uniref:Putative retrovirus-related pol polyprotein from transposon tnt n=1 Tax=Operophtera brumata TaxID=104452 RepID=A0A0L7LUN6_OPEBR|nr:putative retrovirus-related pol polyprotein from transposon tnt [Operophtera brumata]
MASPSHQVASNGNAALQGNNSLTSSIEKLEGVSNYLNWKFAIKMLLTMDGLWNTIEGTETDLVRDQRALARIALCIKPALYQYIRNATTAKGAWKNLADIFENKGLLRSVLLLRQLHRIDYTQFSSMSEYIQGVMTLVQQLSDIGRKTDDAEVAEILLSGLPQEFEYLVSNLETVCLTSDLTSEIVRTRLLQEELRRNTTDEEHYCTGSEDKSRCADSSSASHESVTSLSPDTSVRGEGVTIMEVPRVEATTRPFELKMASLRLMTSEACS